MVENRSGRLQFVRALGGEHLPSWTGHTLACCAHFSPCMDPACLHAAYYFACAFLEKIYLHVPIGRSVEIDD